MAGATLRFDHIGVVVEEMEEGRAFLTEALGIRRWTEVIADPALGVSVQFGQPETGPCFELVAPLGDKSPIAGALRTGKHILNHVAYLTSNLAQQGERLRAQGCWPAGESQSAVAYGGRHVQFWLSPLRFLIELVEAPDHEHLYLGVEAQSDVR